MNMYASIETFAAEYAPYHTMAAFRAGVSDYQTGRRSESYRGVEAQAYDRGLECGMRVVRATAWVERNVGLN
jgi:hypothetical protein